MNKITLSLGLFLLAVLPVNAQNPGLQSLLVGSNKMIAVIAVLVIILLGVAFFLFYLERRIKKLEEQLKK